MPFCLFDEYMEDVLGSPARSVDLFGMLKRQLGNR